MADIREIEQGRLLIKIGKLGPAWVARAFPKPPAKTRGLLAEGRGASGEEALEMLQARLVEDATARDSARRWDEAAGFAVPAAAEFAAALRQARLTDPQVAMLRAHAKTGGRGMTFAELASAGGFTNHTTAATTYGKAGRLIGAALEAEAPVPPGGGDPATAILARTGPARAGEEEPVWVMYPELQEAVLEAL